MLEKVLALRDASDSAAQIRCEAGAAYRPEYEALLTKLVQEFCQAAIALEVPRREINGSQVWNVRVDHFLSDDSQAKPQDALIVSDDGAWRWISWDLRAEAEGLTDNALCELSQYEVGLVESRIRSGFMRALGH